MTTPFRVTWPNGNDLDVNIEHEASQSPVSSVRVGTWDGEEERDNNRSVEIHFGIDPGGVINSGPPLEISIRVDAVVDGRPRASSYGALVDTGERIPAEITVGTVWKTTSQITALTARIRL